MIQCPKCSAENPPNSRFCNSCGQEFSSVSQMPTMEAPEAESPPAPVQSPHVGRIVSSDSVPADGLQDLGRVRVFGTRSAAALPSTIERLPNRDGFQHAIATYVSEGGKVLEGNGVIPDVVVELERKNLLQGVDAVLEAALAWIGTQ